MSKRSTPRGKKITVQFLYPVEDKAVRAQAVEVGRSVADTVRLLALEALRARSK